MIYLIAALAVWRVAIFFVEEPGPLRIAERLRARAGITRYPDGTVEAPATVVAGLLTCVWCLSVWLGVAATLLIWPDDWQLWVLLPFALSGAAVLIEVLRRR